MPNAREYRFVIVNALDDCFAQFLYPTHAPQGLLALRAGLRELFPEVQTDILSWDRIGGEEKLEQILREIRPDAVGVSAYSNGMLLAERIADVSRRVAPETPRILGGIHASAFPEGVGRHPVFDVYVRGEGVRVCARLLRHLFLGESELDDIPSLAFVRDGETVLTPLEALSANMDENPAIDWSLLARAPDPEYRVVRLDEKFCLHFDRGPVYPYESSQGCTMRCAFCERVNGTAFRAHSATRVVRDLTELKRAIDAQMVFFTDENIHSRRGHVDAVLDGLATIHDLGMRYYVAVRAGDVDESLIDRMVDVGVGILHVFPESGSARVRNLMVKDLNMDRFERVVRHASERGLLVLAGFIGGWPSESEAELEQTLELASQPHFDFVFLPALRCLARSELAPILAEHGIEPDTPEYFEYLYNARRLIVADYDLPVYMRALERIGEVNAAKVASERTRAKLDALGCRIEHQPFGAS